MLATCNSLYLNLGKNLEVSTLRVDSICPYLDIIPPFEPLHYTYEKPCFEHQSMRQRTCQACTDGRHVVSASQNSNKKQPITRSIPRPTTVRPGKQKCLQAVRSPVILSEASPPTLNDDPVTVQTLPSPEPTTPLHANIVLPCSAFRPLPLPTPSSSTTLLDNPPCNVEICEDNTTEEPSASDTILPCDGNGSAFKDYLFPELFSPLPANTNHSDISQPHVSPETNLESVTNSPVISRSPSFCGYRVLGNYFQVS